MAKTITRYARGPIGRLLKWSLIVFNVVMVVWGLSYALSAQPVDMSEGWPRMSVLLDSYLGLWVIFAVWALGNIILGIPFALTKGVKHEYAAEDYETFKADKKEETKLNLKLALLAIVAIGIYIILTDLIRE